nr:hypothetical protein [Tanacetum cinerariifolium]
MMVMIVNNSFQLNCIPFEEKPQILLEAWFKFFAIKRAQPKDSNKLFQKLLDNLKELAEYKESLENSSKEIAVSNSNKEKEDPPQDFDIRKLIRKECCVEVSEEQKKKMKDTILELVKICREKEFLCIHDNVEDLIESALNSKLLLINSNSQRLDKKEQEIKNIVEQPAERGSCSNAKNLLPIPSECEVTSEDESECDMPAKDDCSLAFITISNPLFNNNDDLDSSDNESLPAEDAPTKDFKVYSNPLFDEDEINSDKLDPHFQDNDSQREEINIITSTDDVLPPGVENDDSDGEVDDIEELRVDNSILNSEHESSESEESDFDNLSVPLPPPEPPDEEFDFEIDFGDEISVVRNVIVKIECIDARVKFDVSNDKNDDYSYFMFVMVFSFLSAESEDTIFDPGISD